MEMKKKITARERQVELLKGFEGDFYQEKKVGDKWLIKMFNGKTKRWQVAQYSISSYEKYKGYTEETRQDQEIYNLWNY